MTTSRSRRAFLSAQIAELDRLIDALPRHAAIRRMSLMDRRTEVLGQLAATPTTGNDTPTTYLSFRGQPVMNGKGISAHFAAKALGAFSEIVVTLGSSARHPLHSRGPVPRRAEYTLFVTDIGYGSFGFELDADPGHNTAPLEVDSTLTAAVNQTFVIFQSLASGNDQSVSERVVSVHSRALRSIREFLDLLIKSNATCGLIHGDRTAYFEDITVVRRARTMLGDSRVHEVTARWLGHFQGYLPDDNIAEFYSSELSDVVRCRVDRDIQNRMDINANLHRDVHVDVRVRRIGDNIPQYTILSYDIA